MRLPRRRRVPGYRTLTWADLCSSASPVRVASDRDLLADAIRRANHHCVECGEALGGPVLDKGEWLPDSRHRPWCPALIAASDAMLREWLDVIDALHRAGYGADYGNAVPVFSGAA